MSRTVHSAFVVKNTSIILPMDSDKNGGVCGGAAPALIRRDGRWVFAASGRSLEEVRAALQAGEPVEPNEARIALAQLERGA